MTTTENKVTVTKSRETEYDLKTLTSEICNADALNCRLPELQNRNGWRITMPGINKYSYCETIPASYEGRDKDDESGGFESGSNILFYNVQNTNICAVFFMRGMYPLVLDLQTDAQTEVRSFAQIQRAVHSTLPMYRLVYEMRDEIAQLKKQVAELKAQSKS